MGKIIRFQLYSSLPNLSVMAAMTAIIIALYCLSGGSGFIASYYTGLPMMFLILTMVFGCNLSVAQLRVALSMGARRRNYFWGIQLTTLAYTVLLTVFYVVSSALPNLFAFPGATKTFLWQTPWWLFGGCCISMTLVGVVVGFAMGRSKRLGVVALMIAVLVATGVFMTMVILNVAGESWGDLLWILQTAVAVVTIAAEVLVWRGCRRAVVG